MHVFYGACEVIVGGDDGEAIGWCAIVFQNAMIIDYSLKRGTTSNLKKLKK
jgi:hypothetical protein